jgi:hypothetical protein
MALRKLSLFPCPDEEGGQLLCWIPYKDLTSVTGQSMKLKLIYDRQSVGQFVLVSGARLEPVTNFSFSLKFPLDSCGFVIL